MNDIIITFYIYMRLFDKHQFKGNKKKENDQEIQRDIFGCTNMYLLKML